MSLAQTLQIEMTREQLAEQRRKQRDLEVLNRRIEHTQKLLESLRAAEADVIAFNNELIMQRAAMEVADLPRDVDGQIDHEAFMSRDDAQEEAGDSEVSQDPERFDGMA